MNPELAESLLRAVVGQPQDDDFLDQLGLLRSLATYKYDDYQQYAPGRQFIENLALWLQQFETDDERRHALAFIRKRLVYISDDELRHFVSLMARDRVPAVLQRHVANELALPWYRAAAIRTHLKYQRAVRSSIFLGLSDGARIDQFRRFNDQFSNEQFSLSYELSDARANSMNAELREDLGDDQATFTHVFLVDDFAGSGKTIIRHSQDTTIDGRLFRFVRDTLPKLYRSTCPRIFIVLYMCTKQALDHLESMISHYPNAPWTTVNKPQVIHVMMIDDKWKLTHDRENDECDIDHLFDLLLQKHYDPSVEDEHKGKVLHGYADCGLTLVLPHNTPNNSLYLLWEKEKTRPLFPRFERHQSRTRDED